MRRRALVAVLAVLPLALIAAAGCSTDETAVEPVTRASPQEHELDWVERYPKTGAGLVFRVRSLAVTASGWTAEVEVSNRSGVHWELPGVEEAFRRSFGLMLFTDADLEELERLSREGRMPPVRRATTFVPELTTFLEAGTTWKGTISARGKLPGGAVVRVVFGPFSAVTEPPEGMQTPVVWITDRSLELDP